MPWTGNSKANQAANAIGSKRRPVMVRPRQRVEVGGLRAAPPASCKRYTHVCFVPPASETLSATLFSGSNAMKRTVLVDGKFVGFISVQEGTVSLSCSRRKEREAADLHARDGIPGVC